MKTVKDYIDSAFNVFGERTEEFQRFCQGPMENKVGEQKIEIRLPTPKSHRQIRKFEKNLLKALALAEDEEQRSEIIEYLQLVREWKKRVFVGNGWLLLVSLMIFTYYVYATIHNAESFSAFKVEVMEIIEKDPWVMVFNISYVFSFLLYFWAFRAPRWLSRAKGLNGNSSFNPISMFNYGKDKSPTTFTIWRDSSGKVISSSASYGGPLPGMFIVSSFIGLIFQLIFFAFLWMLLPIITLYGIIRFRLLYV